uniref:Uncharacterized protein n=1 Tax=Anopheles coluzzii TaxID=1518534 RepID=A0A8W7P897_ANOCL
MHPVVVGRRMAMENGTESIEDDLDSSATEAFDQSTLSMKQQTKGTVQDIWQRPTRRPLPNAGDVVLCFEIPLARILPTGSAASDGQPVSAAAGKKYGDELRNACQLLDERRNELAVPLLENCFRLLNKIFLDKSKCVLLLLCRLVAACTTSPIPHPSAEQWAELALRRYEHVCDTELLVLYIPLLQTCLHLWWQRGRDRTLLEERLSEMGKKGIKVKGGPTLAQAIHALDPRAETI